MTREFRGVLVRPPSGEDAFAVALRVLVSAEEKIRSGRYRAGLRALKAAHHAFDPPAVERRPRMRTSIAAALAAALLTGSAAFAVGVQRRTMTDPARALQIASQALVAAGHVNDPAALRELVGGVQQTLSDLAPRAAGDPAMLRQLDALAKRQRDVVSRNPLATPDLVARATALIEQLEEMSSAAAAETSPQPSPAPGLP